jgi:hypothetical protein
LAGRNPLEFTQGCWAEKVDSELERKDQQIAELRQRIKKLENGSKG